MYSVEVVLFLMIDSTPKLLFYHFELLQKAKKKRKQKKRKKIGFLSSK